MTLPDERYRAVLAAERMLRDLLDPQKTPKVPKSIRARAGAVLRHYPSGWDMQQVAAACPEVFQERMEDLHRFVILGQQQQRTAEWDPEVNQPHPAKD